MRVLVTGGAGFIGSNLCEALLAVGHTVIAVDNLLTGHLRNVQSLLPHANFAFIDCQTEELPTLAIDAVFHLASPASPVGYGEHLLRRYRRTLRERGGCWMFVARLEPAF